MSENTKDKIMYTALDLFAREGFEAASMSDIASAVGITKAALYKHYAGKREILDRIIAHAFELDAERAAEYDMPEGEPDASADEYLAADPGHIREYTIAQFRHWTEDSFSTKLRRMLTLEQFRDDALEKLYQDCLASGPVGYMAAIFRHSAGSDEEAEDMALRFYSPMFLLYSMWDGAADDTEREHVTRMLERHIDRFVIDNVILKGTATRPDQIMIGSRVDSLSINGVSAGDVRKGELIERRGNWEVDSLTIR